MGQLISMWHDAPDRELLAPDFGSWFASFVDGVFSARYVYDDVYGGMFEVS